MAYARYLDSQNVNWKYESQTFELENCTYTPDFFIYDKNNNLKEIVEVKGFENYDFKRKWKMFEEIHPNEFNITKKLDYDSLKELNIIS